MSLIDSSFFNQMYQQFTPGLVLSFDLNLTTIVDPGPQPDQFSFAILDCNLAEIPTQHLSDALLLIDVSSGAHPHPQSFGPTSITRPRAAALPSRFRLRGKAGPGAGDDHTTRHGASRALGGRRLQAASSYALIPQGEERLMDFPREKRLHAQPKHVLWLALAGSSSISADLSTCSAPAAAPPAPPAPIAACKATEDPAHPAPVWQANAVHDYADAAACQMGGREEHYLPKDLVPGGNEVPVYWNERRVRFPTNVAWVGARASTRSSAIPRTT